MFDNPENAIEEFAFELNGRYPEPAVRYDGGRHSDGHTGENFVKEKRRDDTYSLDRTVHITITDGGILELYIYPFENMRWLIKGQMGGRGIDKVFDSKGEVKHFLDKHLEVDSDKPAYIN